MSHESPLGLVSKLSTRSLGVFRGTAAVDLGIRRKQLTALLEAGVIVRELPDTYRMTAVARSNEQRLRAALIWAGHEAAGTGRSAGETFGLQGVRAEKPEIVVPRSRRIRAAGVIVHQSDDRSALMVRNIRGLRVTGIEATLVSLASTVDSEELEIACEDARRRRLTTLPALNSYLARYARSGRAGSPTLRRLLDELDPLHPSLSTLEVKTRRLLVEHGFTDFEREFPLEWNGRVHHFDFCFGDRRTILETNGRRWHDDPTDYEHDNDKWSVPGRLGYRIVFATWAKVTQHPELLLRELAATLAA